MSRPFISFLMIAYNTERYIEQAVRSVLNQTEKNINLFVRNNGSTDRTGMILQELAQVDSRLHIVENTKNWHDNSGDYFIKDGVVTIWPIPEGDLLGEYVSIVDSDDWLDPAFAEKMHRCAARNRPDIVACGANYICDEKITGTRLPPEIVSRDLRNDCRLVEKHFAALYNTFRAWWGKLFQADYFLKHYDFAWRSINAHLFMDTAVMLRYMRQCRGLSNVGEALYQVRLHAASSYASTREPNNGRLLEAEHLWEEGRETLAAFHAVNQENSDFLCVLNWAYIKEYLPGFRMAGNVPFHKQLGWLAATFSSSILPHYMRGMEKEILGTAMEYTQVICERESRNYALYESYLVRLRYFLILYSQNPGNLLLPALLVGCLSDPVNGNHLGLSMLSALKTKTKGFQAVSVNISYYTVAKSSFNVWADDITGLDDSDQVKTLESRLDECSHAENYAGICDLIEQISRVSPLNYSAMYYRIQMAILAEEWELASALCHTGRTLWPQDTQMQMLCWSLIKDLA